MPSKIVIVGGAWSERDVQAGHSFAGPTGQILHYALRSAGISERDCFFTSVFNLRPPGGNIKSLCGDKSTALPGYNLLQKGAYVRAEFAPELERLHREIEIEDPNVIIACGNTALWALTKKTGIKKFRGAVLPAYGTERKVLPTWSPSAIVKQWNLRPVFVADLMKASRESETKTFNRPRREIWTEPSIKDITEFYNEYIVPAPVLGTDIETKNLTITEIGFAPDPYHAIVIPFYSRFHADGNYWRTFEEERAAWQIVRRVLIEKKHVGQNFQYDVKYLWGLMGMPVPQWIGDTMLQHHALQPEMEKSLGFLGTIYTDEASWKFMRKEHDTWKKED